MTPYANSRSRTGRRSTAQLRYTDVAIALHWGIAALIVYNLASGLLRAELPRGFFVFHVSSGITILVLSLVRVGWRLTHRPPPLLPMTTVEAKLAHVVHFLLYAAMLVLPFSGWAMVSANPPAGSAGAAWATLHPAEPPPPAPAPGTKPAATAKPRGPMMLLGVVKLPLIGSVNAIGSDPARVPEQRALHERIESFHATGGWVMLALLLLHIAGAIKHQVVDRQRELARMGIGKPSPLIS